MKKIFSLLFAICFVASMFAENVTVYCKMTYDWWKTDGAAVAVHYWGGASSTTWPGLRGTAVEGEEDLWMFSVPDDITGVMFVRVNPTGEIADWGAKTKDMTLPTDGNDLFTITNETSLWGDPGCDGVWSKYTPAPADHRLMGTYTVGGEGADFASLFEACAMIDTLGIKGDVQILIATDLTENKNMGVVNPTDFTITFGPAAAAPVKVTFTQTADNAGPSNNFCIGPNMMKSDAGVARNGVIDHACSATLTKNVILDGSFNGEGRYLTFESAVTCNKYNGAILIHGNVQDCAVKNMTIRSLNGSGTSAGPVVIRSQKSTANAPKNILVDNCVIENVVGVACMGVRVMLASGTVNPTGVVVSNCEISATARVIDLQGVTNLTVENNVLNLNGANGMNTGGIFMATAVSGVMDVKANVFNLKTANVTTGDYGATGIVASGGATVWNVENNYFNLKDATGASGDTKLVGVRVGDSCVVRHNTFHLAQLTGAPATAAMSANPISCLYLAATRHIVENNILVSEETVANNSLIRGAMNEATVGNVFHHAGGNAVVVAGATMVVGEEDITAGGKWHAVSLDGYVLTGDSEGDAGLGVDRLESVLVDIDGKERSVRTYAGCYEGMTLVPTAFGEVEEMEEVKPVKFYQNGQLLIKKGNAVYNVQGMRMK